MIFILVAKTLETAVGRSKSDSTEINRKSIQSHVARMVGCKSAWDFHTRYMFHSCCVFSVY